MSKTHDPWFRNRLIRDASYRAIYDHLKEGAPIYIMGEGNHMKIHFDAPQIEKEFPDRVITLPISEDANTNFAVGMMLAGAIPINDIITADFMYRAMDGICNTICKTNFVLDEPKTIVIRGEFMTAGPTTGQRPEALFAHIPGLNVVIPSNPEDAYGLMSGALLHKGATVYFEDRMIEDSTTSPNDLLDEDKLSYKYYIPQGESKIRRRGDELTIVSYGLTLRLLDILLEKHDLDCELIDLRSIYPLDYEVISESCLKTGALLVVEPDVKHGGVGAEIIAQVSEGYSHLRSKRLGAPRVTIPASPYLHDQIIPSEEILLKNIREMLEYW